MPEARVIRDRRGMNITIARRLLDPLAAAG
jgi:hypothetical protein